MPVSATRVLLLSGTRVFESGGTFPAARRRNRSSPHYSAAFIFYVHAGETQVPRREKKKKKKAEAAKSWIGFDEIRL